MGEGKNSHRRQSAGSPGGREVRGHEAMGVRESWGQGGSWNGGDMESQGCVAMESQRRGHSEGWKADSMGTGSRGVTRGLQAPGGVALPPAAGLVWFSEVAFLKGKGKTQTHRGGKAQLFDLRVGRD